MSVLLMSRSGCEQFEQRWPASPTGLFMAHRCTGGLMPSLNFVVRTSTPIVDCFGAVVSSCPEAPADRLEEATLASRAALIDTIVKFADLAASSTAVLARTLGEALHSIRECLYRDAYGPAVVSAWSVVDEVLYRRRRIDYSSLRDNYRLRDSSDVRAVTMRDQLLQKLANRPRVNNPAPTRSCDASAIVNSTKPAEPC